MKFHCDRCKTRYSIADERVRGKILKIRCKNCSAVITVREEMGEDAAPAPPAIPAAAKGAAGGARGSALRGAFEQVMARPTQNDVAQPDPSPSQSFRAPDHFEEEWYVSEDGEQAGPFSLPAAKEWVVAKPPGAELYCWQEDFDDWLPVEKVSHFRGLRGRVETPPPAPRPATVPPPTPGRAPAGGLGRVAAGPVASPDPQPLFTATMNRLEAEQRKRSVSEDALAAKGAPPANGKALEPRAPGAPPAVADTSASIFPDDDENEDDLDLDIGEASRIVNLAMIVPPAGRAGAATPETGAGGGALPGVAKLAAGRQTQSVARIGRGSGEQGAVGMPPLSDAALADAHPPILTPVAEPKRAPLLLLLLIGGAVVAGLVGVLIYVAMSGDDTGDARLSRSQLSGEEFARRGDYDPFRPPAPNEVEGVSETPTNDTTPKPSVKRPAATTTKPAVTSGVYESDDPKVPGAVTDGALTPLRPQEVITMSSRQGLGTRRCYERALKKDPFLDIKNIKVQLTVAPSGVVTEVKLASQAETFLGQCLAATIRTWPFRKSTKGITMDVTLSFEQQG